MAQEQIPVSPAYRVNDYRGKDRLVLGANFGSLNLLYKSATQNNDRYNVPWLDRDFAYNVSRLGRRTLLSLGRWIYTNTPCVAGAIDEQATMASENFQPQFYGADKKWGNQAEEWLYEWGKICDVAGWPYDFDAFKRLAIISIIRDGDCPVLLTENSAGYPMIQPIGAHRVDSRYNEKFILDGEPYEGMRIFDGVIVNDQRCPVAYRVYDEINVTHWDVPANNMALSFIPVFTDQCRGLSGLASAAFDWQDIKESRYWELIAQKACAAQTLIETNESGMADPVKQVFQTAPTFNTDNTKATTAIETMEGGIYRYLKAKTGSDIKPFTYDRPGQNVQSYQDSIMRDALAGMEWSYFFGVDPTKAGGATMRVVVEKINNRIRKLQGVLEKLCRRIHGYAISKAIKLGQLPPSDEWWKWEYQLPAEITADRKYDSDVDQAEILAGISTRKRACAKRGEYYEDVDAQRELETVADFTRAQRIAKQFNVSVEFAMAVLKKTGNYSFTSSEAPDQTAAEPTK